MFYIKLPLFFSDFSLWYSHKFNKSVIFVFQTLLSLDINLGSRRRIVDGWTWRGYTFHPYYRWNSLSTILAPTIFIVRILSQSVYLFRKTFTISIKDDKNSRWEVFVRLLSQCPDRTLTISTSMNTYPIINSLYVSLSFSTELPFVVI